MQQCLWPKAAFWAWPLWYAVYGSWSVPQTSPSSCRTGSVWKKNHHASTSESTTLSLPSKDIILYLLLLLWMTMFYALQSVVELKHIIHLEYLLISSSESNMILCTSLSLLPFYIFLINHVVFTHLFFLFYWGASDLKVPVCSTETIFRSTCDYNRPHRRRSYPLAYLIVCNRTVWWTITYCGTQSRML